MHLNAYLSFSGNCEAAFAFYLKHLGGEIMEQHRYAGSPMEAQCPSGWGDKIMHMRARVGDMVLMGSDAGGECAPEKLAGFSLSINTADPAEAERIFAAMSENAVIGMPLAETFWARRFGMLTDQFGVPWMVNCE